ncbi:hypothetical protein A2483_00290 [Candidatus Peregrinibacteria bacterium RIFOXYC2_FULL_33_13]|nr:MAG: hypothetical protein UR27_C0023G0003 [Candidatus Peregrinibacteria bacterium GW2011_GWA2_33_10]KKP38347.1 MAG: hypothetical protein UR30_C0020G0003 [Candidatus Peregrinibacteria bacterium GW2011_GWC2_33_13]OGJ53555.1 MAG: hypothetical protein A2483_00290 [Candidatus Peregrinibacteria bacterium RIFOXYC2_FULL_33_13]
MSSFQTKIRISKGFNSRARLNNGVLDISLSRYLNDVQKKEIIDKFTVWADKKLSNIDREWQLWQPDFHDGEILRTLNKNYQLVFHKNEKKLKIKLRGNFIDVFLDNDLDKVKIRKSIMNVLAKDNQSFLTYYLKELNKKFFHGELNKCLFRNQNSRFGSCSRKGNINISSKLLFAPKEVFFYICVHELAHLIHFNHSKSFWRFVAGIDPQYKEKEVWLKNNGWHFG